MLIDGHLDLAWNAAQGRDLTLKLEHLRERDPLAPAQTATVSFPELAAAGLRACFGTLFALPRTAEQGGYTDHAGARQQALAQLEQYHRWEDAGLLRVLRTCSDLQAVLNDESSPPGVVLLMEGADPVSGPDDLAFWQAQGVRLIGPAWGRTRYAGGTDAPGPLTPAGHDLVRAMTELQLTLDAAHLDDASFWDAADLGVRMVCTHANARARVPGNRQLSDEMARHIVVTGGVLGLVLHSRFIRPGWHPGDPRAPLGELLAHAEHLAALVGWEHLALGSDLDGGFGSEKMPLGIERYRDLETFIRLLPPTVQAGVRGAHWQRWLLEHCFTS